MRNTRPKSFAQTLVVCLFVFFIAQIFKILMLITQLSYFPEDPDSSHTQDKHCTASKRSRNTSFSLCCSVHEALGKIYCTLFNLCWGGKIISLLKSFSVEFAKTAECLKTVNDFSFATPLPEEVSALHVFYGEHNLSPEGLEGWDFWGIAWTHLRWDLTVHLERCSSFPSGQESVPMPAVPWQTPGK